MERKSFFKGALILSAAGILSKVLGAVYRIPLARLVGQEGIGIYQMAYPFYMVILALSSAGIPLAISKLVSERDVHGDRQGINRIITTSLKILMSLGMLFALLLFFGAEFVAENILKEPRAIWSLRAITPAIFFTSAMATLRGYFQGFQNMTPTALTQITEQIFRVGTVFAASLLLVDSGIEYAVAGANFGASVGGAAALTLVFFLWKRDKKKSTELYSAAQLREAPKTKDPELGRRILKLAIPISLGALVLPLMQVTDLLIVPARLQATGYSVSEATGLFGQLSGMAGALINLPFILTTAIAASLVPAIAENRERGEDLRSSQQFSSGMMLALIIVLPAALGLLLLAEPICLLLYDEPAAGAALAWLALAVIAIGIYQVSSGALQGAGKPLEPMKSFFLGITLKALLTYLLVGIYSFNIRGAALATVISFFVAAARNIIKLNREIGREWFSFPKHIFRPGMATLIMSLIVVFSQTLFIQLGLRDNLITVLTVLLGGLSYAVALPVFGGVNKTDLEKIPGVGKKAAKILVKMKLAR